MDPISMPYLVIVIDEMADLMMCSGQGCGVRGSAAVADGARGRYPLIMATQRPSVDVVTGTIKANFPSRISFQVTSEIDSRTIIGEQGAEQLLGAGDMLYMASGGRIMRAHGPFVSDEEVEAVGKLSEGERLARTIATTFWRTREASRTARPRQGGGDKNGDLYNQAVEIVLKDRKPTAELSAAAVQDRLQPRGFAD